MTKRKRGMLVWALIGLGLPSWCADFWDGNAAILKGDARFESGVFAASNSFPTDTEIQIQNLENQKTVNAVVTQRISGQSDILVFLSPKAGDSLGMAQGRMNRVRIKVPLRNAVPASILGSDMTENPDPDINPSAGMAQTIRAAAVSETRPALSETPSAEARPAILNTSEKATTEAVTASPTAPTESVEESTLQKTTEQDKGGGLSAAASPEPPIAVESKPAAAAAETVKEQPAAEAAAPAAAAETVKEQPAAEAPATAAAATETQRPAALDEVLSRVPQKRLFLPPRQDELFAYRKPVEQATTAETKAAAVPMKESPVEPAKEPVKAAETPIEPTKELVKVAETPIEPAKEPAKAAETPIEPAKEPAKAAEMPIEPAKEPVKAAEMPIEPAKEPVKVAETPAEEKLIASESASSYAKVHVVPADKIAAVPEPPTDDYEVGHGEAVLRIGAPPQLPGHEPSLASEQPKKEPLTQDVSDATPDNPVWTPSVADIEPTDPNPPEETKPLVAEKPVETGPEEPGIDSKDGFATEGSGLPTGIVETPKVAMEALMETASDIRPTSGRSGTITEKPTDKPLEPPTEIPPQPAPEAASKPAPEAASKPAPEAASKPAPEAASKPAPEAAAPASNPSETVVVLEQTRERPPAEVAIPIEKPAPEAASKPAPEAASKPVEPPVTASRPATALPVKTSLLKPGEFYLQLAAYATESIAQETIQSLAAIYPVGVLPPVDKGKTLYRVVVGPLNKAESGTLLNWFKYRGFPDAFLKAGE